MPTSDLNKCAPLSTDGEASEAVLGSMDSEDNQADDIVDLVYHDWELVPGQSCIRRHLLSVLRGNATRTWLFQEAIEHLRLGLDASSSQLLIAVDSQLSGEHQQGPQSVLVLSLDHKASGTWLTGCSVLTRALRAVAKRLYAHPAKLAAAELQLEGLAPQPIPQQLREEDAEDTLPIPTLRLSIYFGSHTSSQCQAPGHQVHNRPLQLQCT